jgi:hypothetical protein
LPEDISPILPVLADWCGAVPMVPSTTPDAASTNWTVMSGRLSSVGIVTVFPFALMIVSVLAAAVLVLADGLLMLDMALLSRR